MGTIFAHSMLNPERSAALDEFIRRSHRRKFSDGPIGGLRIQEYWHSDIPPFGSEQNLRYFQAAESEFDSVSDFGFSVFLFCGEDDIQVSARHSIDVRDQLMPIEVCLFVDEWHLHAAKVSDAPCVPADDLADAWSISDEWNDKLFIAVGLLGFFALHWSTSA